MVVSLLAVLQPELVHDGTEDVHPEYRRPSHPCTSSRSGRQVEYPHRGALSHPGLGTRHLAGMWHLLALEEVALPVLQGTMQSHGPHTLRLRLEHHGFLDLGLLLVGRLSCHSRLVRTSLPGRSDWTANDNPHDPRKKDSPRTSAADCVREYRLPAPAVLPTHPYLVARRTLANLETEQERSSQRCVVEHTQGSAIRRSPRGMRRQSVETSPFSPA